MRHPHVLWTFLCLSACSGPPAPDAAVCQDVIFRLCQSSVCPGVSEALDAGSDCGATLTERTGCDTGDFAFTSPSRERFLDCREPLLSQGTGTERPPTCGDVLRFLTDCPDAADFFREGPP